MFNWIISSLNTRWIRRNMTWAWILIFISSRNQNSWLRTGWSWARRSYFSMISFQSLLHILALNQFIFNFFIIFSQSSFPWVGVNFKLVNQRSVLNITSPLVVITFSPSLSLVRMRSNQLVIIWGRHVEAILILYHLVFFIQISLEVALMHLLLHFQTFRALLLLSVE